MLMGGWRALPGCRRTLEQAYILSCCSTFDAAPVWAVYGTAYPIYSRQRRVKTVSKAIISIRKLLAAVRWWCLLPLPSPSSHSFEKPRNPEMGTCSQLLWFSAYSSSDYPLAKWCGVCCVTCACSDYSGFGSRGCAVHPSVQFVLIL